MISFGQSIKTANDPLKKLELKVLADKIIHPKQEFINKITQLRNVHSVDPNKYRELKTMLPYVVAAVFNPPYRKIAHFAYTDYFILDIDHLSEKEMDLNHLFEKIKTDPFVVLMFRSPSMDGLKIFFKFEERCFDAAKFSLFYKVFAKHFASQYNIHQVVDSRTSDVSRACFVSWDPHAYFNEKAQPVKISSFINFDNQIEIFELEKELKQEEKEQNKTKTTEKQPLSNDVLQAIKEQLNPKIKEKKEKKYFVPEELNQIIDQVKEKMKAHQIDTLSIDNIHYGKRFRFSMDNQWAEINVFYGKKGFSVVPTTKSGSNAELAEVCALILNDLLL